jgi:nucleoside-diphosphate-sugar epimerase
VIDGAASYPTLTGLGAKRLGEGAWRIAVAGAGGWMGLAVLEELHGLLRDELHHRVACFGSSRRRLKLRGGLTVDQAPLSDLVRLPPAPTLVLHLAFLTQEKAGLMSRQAYIAANGSISDQVFNALGPIGAEGVFVASSGAVEMVGQSGADANKALYGALKLEDEARFGGWALERGKRTVIARIFGLSGPYINKLDSYALACFVADALADRPIDITATRPVFRSYVAVDELMSVVFALLTDGTAGLTLFDTAGKRGYEMEEIARAVAGALGHSRGIRRPAMASVQEDRYVGDGAIYAGLRRDQGVEAVGFSRQVRETAKFMVEIAAVV